MKKLIITALLLALSCLLMFSCTEAADDGEDSTNEPTVTSPDGFEDVTAPPIETDPEKTPDTDAPESDEVTEKTEDTSDKDDDTTAPEEEDTTDADTTEAGMSPMINDSEEAVEAARAWLGETDPETGYKYAYSYDGSMIDGETVYFRIRVSWYIEEQERYSLCGYLLVSPTGEISKYSW